MNIIINAQSVWYGQEQRICFLYRFVLRQFFDKLIGFGCIAFAEDCPFISFDVAKAISPFALLTKVKPILVVYQCKNRAAYRYPCFALVPGIFPGFFI